MDRIIRVDTLRRLQEWFSSQCDGDWEHSYGVRVETLDNPGWTVRVDLTGTLNEGLKVKRVIDRGEESGAWIQCWADGATLDVACGPKMLDEALRIVVDLLEDVRDSDG